MKLRDLYSFLFCVVVPPGIVINSQVVVYHYFSEVIQEQSPPIAPPLDFCVLRVVAADDFLGQR